MTTAIVCTALLAALLFALSINTSRMRGASTNQLPTQLDDPLFVAIRAHGNAAENHSMLAVLMLLIGSRDPAIWMLVLMGVVTAARFGHAIGVLLSGDMGKETPLRLVSAVITSIGGLALAATAIVVM